MASRTFARAAGFLMLATLAVIATLCVLDENIVSTPYEYIAKTQQNSDDKIGNDLLESEARSINDADKARRKGKGMGAVDDMLHDFQKEGQDDEFTEALKQSAPKKDDLAESISPERLGFVPPTGPYIPEFQLVQDWTPNGQSGLKDDIESAKGDQEKVELEQDGLKGHSLLSAVGLAEDDDADNWSLLQASSDSDAWTPSGQAGIAEAIGSKKDEQEMSEMKEDGLAGNHLLSAVGMESDEETNDDELSTEDLMLVQVQDDAQWVPHGQGGLDTQLQSAQADQDAAEMKEDGLQGDGILGAVGMAGSDDEETVFVQQDAAIWQPQGQKIKKAETYDELSEEEHNSHSFDDDLYDGLSGSDSILGAIGLGHHMKPSDEVDDLGTIHADDIDLDFD